MTDADNKGYSEETCVRCGWTMGQPALNCQNDDTPHVFPSQQAERDRLVAERDAAEAQRLAYAQSALDMMDRHKAELDLVIRTRNEYVEGWKARAEAAEAERDKWKEHDEAIDRTVKRLRAAEAERDRLVEAIDEFICDGSNPRRSSYARLVDARDARTKSGAKFTGFAENISGMGREVRRDNSTVRELVYLAADRAIDGIIEAAVAGVHQ